MTPLGLFGYSLLVAFVGLTVHAYMVIAGLIGAAGAIAWGVVQFFMD